MVQELRNPFGRVYLTIDINSKNRWVHVNWMGYLTEENIKAGAAAYTKALSEAGYTCVLNDTRLIIGGWDHSLDRVVNEWAPRAARAGLKHFAMITTPETFAGSTAATFYNTLKSFETKVFDNTSDAQEWLRQYTVGVKS
ncbi:STAS/SEC14 domain-containing protein [Pontibacter mangrovi]|uniref:STAS/SEC14 domain-containing protein n=1 Tax=Pontibacter mangrovi TaxID=2589816 RepID=A0A501WGU1_9BACT|nr:STAS/SEC14 domain-containing protein [Pontibacter mangrovi]TPE46341.1 STAS/SEC14 domain-containing protein [Pontibacter mangrovi]